MEQRGEQPAGRSTPPTAERKNPAWQLRKYLLLLATLVATVTYVTAIDPPGGVWLETEDGHLTGNPILPATRHIRYLTFYYFNATAFAASLVVILLLLHLRKAHLRAVRGVMVLQLLCLMVAYVAGSCRGVLTTVYASLLAAAVFAYVVAHTLLPLYKPIESVEREPRGNGKLRLKERRKVLMLLAIFVATITYTAGLSPPGGFWEHAQEGQGGRRAGDSVLQEGNSRRFVAFFVCNTTAFVASLAIIMLLLSSRLRNSYMRLSALYGCIAVALLGLMGAYAAGSCRETHSTVYVLCLVGAVFVYISVVAVVEILDTKGSLDCCQVATTASASVAPSGEDPLDKARSLILLLATLAATVTYQAGLDPPGGVWRDNRDGHNGGDLVLLAMHAWRYKVFFYSNSAAFVASIIVIIMVQSRSLLKLNRHALEAAVILDLFGLMGAYIAGSCRDVRSSIYVFALAAVIFIFMMIHVVVQKSSGKLLSPPTNGGDDAQGKLDLEKRRKLLLLLAILAVTITYRAGLTPPGGFWIEDADKAHHYGDPVLADNYPRRYKVFFYCNATSFMASVAVIILLVNRNMSDVSKEHYSYRALYVCMVAGLFGLMGAFAAGTSRTVRTSIYVFCLVGLVLIFAVLHIRVVHEKLEDWFSCQTLSTTDEPAAHSGDTRHKDSKHLKYIEGYRMRKYLMLLGILAASVTYEAGLAPPGDVWPDNGEGHAAGNPILSDTDRPRYRAFFYSNSTSFVASVVVVVLLLQGILLPRLRSPLLAMHTAVVLDLLGLLVAYAAGSCRDWGTSAYVLAMAIAALAYLGIYAVLSIRGEEARGGGWSSRQQPSLQELEQPAGRQLDVVEVGAVDLDVVEAGAVELDVVQVPVAHLV